MILLQRVCLIGLFLFELVLFIKFAKESIIEYYYNYYLEDDADELGQD